MIEMLKRHEVQVLRQAGHTWKAIAALSGVSVRRIAAEDASTTIDNAGERARRQVGRPSKADAYRDVLLQALTEPMLRSVALLHRARQAGYTGGKSAVYVLARLTRWAHFPFLKTIDDFNFTYQATLRLTMLGSALSPGFVTEGRSLILTGKPGRGKPTWRSRSRTAPSRTASTRGLRRPRRSSMICPRRFWPDNWRRPRRSTGISPSSWSTRWAISPTAPTPPHALPRRQRPTPSPENR